MINKDNLLEKLLQEEWNLLHASMETLLRSVIKCSEIGTKADYSFEEHESFDSLTSKFNRTSDLFTQKVIRTIWMLLHEPFVPFIDMMNMCEKTGIILSANQLISIRDMRNQISHEYIPEALLELVPEVIDMTQQLIGNINYCSRFIKGRNWIVEKEK
ncbi:MAG TPA: hypothetical protein P5084_02615 [Paludibacter sp.]|nr:hypothetical protein [Paludibacter sp.]